MSFRYVEPDRALMMRMELNPKISTVGVFVDEDPRKIAEIAESGAIEIVQLHGHEDEAYIKRLREYLPEGVPVWKAFKIRSAEDLQKAEKSSADSILLDNGYGTGKRFDHGLLDENRIQRDFILAGGLTPENLPEVLEKYHPAIVDISTGVETGTEKDKNKILRAVGIVRGD